MCLHNINMISKVLLKFNWCLCVILAEAEKTLLTSFAVGQAALK